MAKGWKQARIAEEFDGMCRGRLPERINIGADRSRERRRARAAFPDLGIIRGMAQKLGKNRIGWLILRGICGTIDL